MTKVRAQNGHYLKQVREQYENYPYPPRNPELEKSQFICTNTCQLDRMNYYHFAGKRDFTKGFRALVAGGGTGDATITLAQQLKGSDAEIVHLDISHSSMQIAQARAKIRGLANITWVHGSLLDAPETLTGKFDFINCSGVLHHLESPEAGLAALAAVLKDDGVLDLMLYARYGRESIYQLQALMRLINRGEDDMQRKVDNCRAVLKILPKTHSFREIQDTIYDLSELGDAGIYDLFLHSQDVAYSVPDLYALLASAKLQPTHFFCSPHATNNNLYRLESYLGGSGLAGVIAHLSLQERQAAAELMHGRIMKHAFYASRATPSIPDMDNLDNVPFYSMLLPASIYEVIRNSLQQFPLGKEVLYTIGERSVRFIKTANADRLFACLDGSTSLGDIFKHARSAAAGAPAGIEALKKEFSTIFEAFSLHDLMYLRHRSAPRVKTVDELTPIRA